MDLSEQMDASLWPEMKKVFAAKFGEKTMAEWADIFRGSEAQSPKKCSFSSFFFYSKNFQIPQKAWINFAWLFSNFLEKNKNNLKNKEKFITSFWGT